MGALSQLVSPLALNQVTDYMDRHDAEGGGGVPLLVVVSVAGLFLGQVCFALRASPPRPPPVLLC